MTYITPDVDVRAEGGFWFESNGKWGRRLFKDPYPLSSSRFLVSMTPTGDPREKTKWGLYALDASGEAALLYQNAALGCFQPMPLRARPVPPVIPSNCDRRAVGKSTALCVVQDVYQGMEGIRRGDVKWIRINEQGPRLWSARRAWDGDEYDQHYACISKDASLGLKVQHGVVPIEPDGSAYFAVPADRNLFFQVLDANFMELQRERTYVNYRPGETRSCVGCHETPNLPPSAQSRTPLALKRPPSVPGPQPGGKERGASALLRR